MLKNIKMLALVALLYSILLPSVSVKAQATPGTYTCDDGTVRVVLASLPQEDKESFCNSPPRNAEECNEIVIVSVREACIATEANPSNTASADPTQGSNLSANCKEDSNGNGTPLDKDDCGIVGYIITFTNVLSALVGIVIVIMIAVGGLQYSAARDDPQAVGAAKNRIRNAVLALVFYLFTFAFLQWLIPGGIF